MMAFTKTTGLRDEVARLMSWPVATVDISAELPEILEALASNDIGAAAVTANERFVGIISERDVLRLLADGANPETISADELVVYSPVCASPDDTVLSAGHAMVDAGVRHLPVVEGDEIVGMVSLRDVTAVLLLQAEALPVGARA
jgi:CBS domain-containing protein